MIHFAIVIKHDMCYDKILLYQFRSPLPFVLWYKFYYFIIYLQTFRAIHEFFHSLINFRGYQ